MSTRAAKQDLISQLPDDLLYNIISYLNLRDVAKSSVLSHKWKHICSCLPLLRFDSRNILMTDADCELLKTWNIDPKEIFVRGVDQFLEFHQGTQIYAFIVTFCLDDKSTNDIDQWVRFAVGKKAEVLVLDLYCGKCCPMYNVDQFGARISGNYVLRSEVFECAKANLKHLYLAGCILGPNFTGYFNSLEALCLSYSLLSEYDLHGLFSSLVKLKTLCFKSCRLPVKLCLGLLPLLEEFIVQNSGELQEIALSNLKLFRIVCIYCGTVTFDLRGAPNLKILAYLADRRGLQQVFTCVPAPLLLKEFSVFNETDGIECIPETISTFSRVTYLSLCFIEQSKFHVLKMISILKAFPSLWKLNLLICCPEDFDKENPELGEYVPMRLTQVEFGGFYSTPNQIAFVIHLLKHASALKRLVIKQEIDVFDLKRQAWDDGQRQMIYKKFQKSAKKGVLIIK